MSDGKPKSNKMIKLTCSDYGGEYVVYGMFINYKKPPKPGKDCGSRFCIKNKDGVFEASRKDWESRERWEYIEGEVE